MRTCALTTCLFVLGFAASLSHGQQFESLASKAEIQSRSVVAEAERADLEIEKITKAKEESIAEATKSADAEITKVLSRLLAKTQKELAKAAQAGASDEATKLRELESTILAAAGGKLVSPTNELRVLSFNIHHGQGLDGKLDIERIAKIITDTNPDVVALQEVDVRTKRSRGVDQAKELARRCNMKSCFGRTINYSGGQYGNAILTKHKIVTSKNFALPQGGKENRGAMAATIRTGDNLEFTIVSTHFDHADDQKTKARTKSSALLAELISQSSLHVIVAGDLNCEPSAKELAPLTAVLKPPSEDPVLTFPAANPSKQIDYILVDRRAKWTTSSIEALDGGGASDHRPVLAVFDVGAK